MSAWRTNRASRQASESRLLEQTQAWILADLQRSFRVDALATAHGMSRSNFSHFFRSRTGLTPARFISETRLQEAARLLIETRGSVTQIAETCGFANANHFNRAFQPFKHMTPGAYRRSTP